MKEEITVSMIKGVLPFSECEHYGLPVVSICGVDYAVADGEGEADGAVREAIRSSIPYFTVKFLSEHSNHSERLFEVLSKSMVEDVELYMSLINNFDEFVEDAVGSDGRGHFLSSYDGEEVEVGGYYLYRL